MPLAIELSSLHVTHKFQENEEAIVFASLVRSAECLLQRYQQGYECQVDLTALTGDLNSPQWMQKIRENFHPFGAYVTGPS